MYQSLTFSHLKIFFVLKMKSLNHDFSFKKLFYDIKFIFTENLLNKIKYKILVNTCITLFSY